VRPAELIEAVLSALKRLPENAFGIHIALEHPGDDSGILMLVTVAEKRPLSSRGNEKTWQSYERVVLNGKVLRASGLCTSEPLRPNDLKEFAAVLQTALDAPSEQGISIRLGVAVDKR
jgi:hypothetical protein